MSVSKTTTQEAAEKFWQTLSPSKQAIHPMDLVEFAELLLYHPQGCGHRTAHGCTICQTCFACCECDFYTSLEERAKAFTRERYDDELNDVTDLADFAHEVTAELQKENARLREALEGLLKVVEKYGIFTGNVAFAEGEASGAINRARAVLNPSKGGAVQEGLSKEKAK